MRKQFIVILLVCLALVGLTVSCKNEVEPVQFGKELVSVSFANDSARGLTATLEAFDKQGYYWAYAAKKADGSNLISGQTANYGKTDEVHVWVKTDGSGNPVSGLGSGGTSDYEAYKVSGFSQGYWNFKLYAYKGYDTTTKAGKDLVYQGETLNVLLKSDAVNAEGSHLVSVIVNPVQSEGNGTMVFLTDIAHDAETDPLDRIIMNTVNSATYGTDYTVKVLSILSIADFPVEYVGSTAEKQVASCGQDGVFSLPAGSYKVTVAFTNMAGTLNYARGTIVATVYSNLTTTIGGDLTEAMTYAQFDGVLNPDLITVTAVSDAITYDDTAPTTQVSFSSTGAAKAVTATTTKAVTNQIIEEIAATNGTDTINYDQSLKLTLNVETVESTPTTATYEIGMSAKLTSKEKGTQTIVAETTSDVSEVDEHVTVVLQLQPGLTDVNVLHDGNQMAESPAPDAGYGVFSYNSGNGELTIITRSFSPFTVSFTTPAEADYVAQVGNLKYTTLSAAIANAKDSATVTLLKSITLTDAVDFDVVSGRLDLAGYTITGNLTASAAGAIIKNGSIAGTLTVSGNSALIEDLAVTGGISVGGTGAVLDNCSVSATGAYAVDAENGNATIKSGTYKAATNEKILNGSILVEDGNFKGTLTESTNVSLIGGVYDKEVSDVNVAKGYECAKVSEGVYTVRKGFEARNVTTKTDYYFLQDAINEASEKDTIELLCNVEVKTPVVVPSTHSITLDLAGMIITVRVKDGITNEGTLSIDGTDENSKIIGADIDGLVKNKANGVMTLKGGAYELTHYSSDLCAKYYVVYNNGSSLTVDGATIDSFRGGIRTTAGDLLVKTASININVGEGVTSDIWARGIYVSDDSNSAVIEDGTYSYYGRADGAMIRTGDNRSIVVKGGSFTVKKYAEASEYAKAMAGEGSSFEISGGIWTGDIGRYGENTISGGKFVDGKFYVESGSLVITGGTFCEAVNIYNTLENYVDLTKYYIDDSVTGEKTVLRIPPEASIMKPSGKIYYDRVQDAFDAVLEGEIIYLERNVKGNNPIIYSKSYAATFDLADYTLMIYGDVDGNDGGRAIKITAGTLTIKNGTIDGRDYDNDLVTPVPNQSTDEPWSANRIGGAVRVSGGNAILEDLVMYNNDGWGNAVKLESANSLTVNDCVIYSSYGGAFEIGKGTATIKDTTIVLDLSTGSYQSTGIAVCYGGTANVINCTVNSAGYALFCYSSAGTINVTGGTYKGANKLLAMDTRSGGSGDNSGVDSVVVLNSGSFDGAIILDNQVFGSSTLEFYDKLSIHGGSFANFSLSGATGLPNEIVIDGGTFDANPSAFVALGYWARHYAATATAAEYWTVTAVPQNANFALINNETQELTYLYGDDIHKYDYNHYDDSSLQPPAGIPANHTLVLLRNYEYSFDGYTFVYCIGFVGDNITFDLNNHVFTFNASVSYVFACRTTDYGTPAIKNLNFKNGTIQYVTSNPKDTKILFADSYQTYCPERSSFQTESVTYVNITDPWTKKTIENPWNPNPTT